MSKEQISNQMIVTLTVGELKAIVEDAVRSAKEQQPVQAPERKKICGIQGLANYVGCALATAQKLKNESKVPYFTVGNRVFFYSDLVDDALLNGRA